MSDSTGDFEKEEEQRRPEGPPFQLPWSSGPGGYTERTDFGYDGVPRSSARSWSSQFSTNHICASIWTKSSSPAQSLDARNRANAGPSDSDSLTRSSLTPPRAQTPAPKGVAQNSATPSGSGGASETAVRTGAPGADTTWTPVRQCAAQFCITTPATTLVASRALAKISCSVLASMWSLYAATETKISPAARTGMRFAPACARS
mmetsp:Transcript_448/g.1533  ORF Transcript_448/g.1533 Transcript_448/m.1533 type:complete len:204 (-) Transcript_448:149-760(-)